jgi:hypothetical protein
MPSSTSTTSTTSNTSTTYTSFADELKAAKQEQYPHCGYALNDLLDRVTYHSVLKNRHPHLHAQIRDAREAAWDSYDFIARICNYAVNYMLEHSRKEEDRQKEMSAWEEKRLAWKEEKAKLVMENTKLKEELAARSHSEEEPGESRWWEFMLVSASCMLAHVDSALLLPRRP